QCPLKEGAQRLTPRALQLNMESHRCGEGAVVGGLVAGVGDAAGDGGGGGGEEVVGFVDGGALPVLPGVGAGAGGARLVAFGVGLVEGVEGGAVGGVGEVAADEDAAGSGEVGEGVGLLAARFGVFGGVELGDADAGRPGGDVSAEGDRGAAGRGGSVGAEGGGGAPGRGGEFGRRGPGGFGVGAAGEAGAALGLAAGGAVGQGCEGPAPALHGLLEAADVAFADSLEEDGVRADLASADLGGVHPCGDLLAEGGGVGAEGAPGFGVAVDVRGHRVDGVGVRVWFVGSGVDSV